MTASQEDDGKQEGNPKPIKEVENKSEDTKAKEDLEDEENKDDFEEDLMVKLVFSLEDISGLKKENEELKKKLQDGDHSLDKTRKEVDLFKLQVQEKDKELPRLKDDCHQNKKRYQKVSTLLFMLLKQTSSRSHHEGLQQCIMILMPPSQLRRSFNSCSRSSNASNNHPN